MDYELLETFVVLCETENITKTAAMLYKTQPAISNRIRLLEEELGFTLINRSKGKKLISLTSKGDEFLTVAQRLISAYSEIDATKSRMRNSLSVSSIASLGSPIVSDICKNLSDKYDTKINLFTYQTDDAYRMIADKELDVAFVPVARKVRRVLCEPMFTQRYMVVRYCETPMDVQIISSDELDRTLEIYQRWSDVFKLWHDSKFGTDGYKVQVDSCVMLKDFIRNSNLWAIVPEENVLEIKKDIPVQLYRLSDPPPQRICYMLTNTFPDKNNFQIIQKFREETESYAEKKRLYSKEL